MAPSVYLVRAQRPSELAGRVRALLSPAELAAVGAMTPRLRDRSAARKAATRVVLGRALGVSPERVPLFRSCSRCGSTSHGPVVLRDGPFVSVSHSDEWTVVAWCDDQPLGVDVERRGTTPWLAGLAVWTDKEKRALADLDAPRRHDLALRWWTVKEAVLKQRGTGLMTPPENVEAMSLWPSPVVTVPAPDGLVVTLASDRSHLLNETAELADLLGVRRPASLVPG